MNTRPALIALLTTGCVDFGLVAPGERETGVQVRADVSHAETLAVAIEVLLFTAADAAGRPYELADPTIYIHGAALRPAVRPANGIYTYRTTLHPPEPADPAEFLQVSIPALAAGAATPPAIAIPFTGRRGDVTLSLGARDDLVLGIAAPAAGHTATNAYWYLELRASCDSAGRIFAILNSSGRPPDPLIVPRLILQQLAPPKFDACLRLGSSTTSVDAGYRGLLIVQTRAQWHVEIRQTERSLERNRNHDLVTQHARVYRAASRYSCSISRNRLDLRPVQFRNHIRVRSLAASVLPGRSNSVGKVVGGSALLLIALLMVVGFLGADVDASAPATLVAALIGIGLPAAGGVALLASHFGVSRRIDQRRDQLRRQTVDAEILRLAAQRGGKLTVVEVVTELALTPQAATETLNALMARDVAEIEVTDSGVLVYAFRDVQHLPDKASSREILDA